MKKLDGKVAIITGANSGVGACVAELFAKAGAKVVISARRVEPLNEVAQRIQSEDGVVLAIPTDISKASDVKNLVCKAMENFGKVDILVNNAGILDKNLLSIANFETEDLDRVLDINTKGAMYCIREVLGVMGEGSSIINVDSVAGQFGTGGACYVASKAALIGITKHTALINAKNKIRCNAICPGTIITPMTSSIDTSNLDMTVLGAMSKHNDLTVPPCMPIDVANTILFLASDESKAITGQILVHDFGSTL